MTARVRTAAYWLLPSLFCLAVSWYGLKAWFSGDDFLMLGLSRGVHDWDSLMYALFAPTRHGTFRPLSERGFFLLFYPCSVSITCPTACGCCSRSSAR